MTRELFVLNPYRLPTHHTLMLSAEDVTSLLNGYLALWHPAALRGATAPPRIASAYDHEAPLSGHVYAVPTSPPLFLPDDWEQRVASAGATCFRATPDRAETVRNLLSALGADQADAQRDSLFSALGLGYLLLEAVFEAMDHLPQLAVEEFWREITAAVTAEGLDECRVQLASAAQRLRETREILYPNTVYLVELILLNDQGVDAPLPRAVELGLPAVVIASGQYLERLAAAQPGAFERLRAAVKNDVLDVCGGPYRDRHDAFRTVESQLWNLQRGLAACEKLLGQPLRIHGRRRFAATPQTPGLLNAAGLYKSILLQFDESVLPQYRTAVIEWAGLDGKRIETFTRRPELADNPSTYFHLAYYLGRTMLQDMTASFVLLHAGQAPPSYHADWLELHRLAPVFGQFVTLSRFFGEVQAGEYPAPLKADDLHSCYLDDLHGQKGVNPVSRFAAHARGRHDLEAVWTLAGLYRGMSRQADLGAAVPRLNMLEDDFELERPSATADTLPKVAGELLASIAERLLSKSESVPGHLLLNPCSFPRRAAVELPGVATPLPAPARATQVEGEKARVVVDVPALGFAWVPCRVDPGAKVVIPRHRPVDGHTLKNEFFEAEVDPQTGGLKGLRDPRRGANRIGQQLVFVPGSTMRARSVRVTSTGPALGEIVTEGDLIDSQDQVLAGFRQRYRCWWGRPLLEAHIELQPAVPPIGYPWHACYAARFAWRDDKAHLYRSMNQRSFPTSQTRPEAAECFEIKCGAQSTAILTGGLPFLQRQGKRMVDVILLPEGEEARTFDLALVLDAEDAVSAARDFLAPIFTLPAAKGPPQVGASGWLCHVDVSNVLLGSLRPVAGADAVIARLFETRGVATQAALHCLRHPVRAVLLDECGTELGTATVEGDAVNLYFAAGEMQRLRVEFA